MKLIAVSILLISAVPCLSDDTNPTSPTHGEGVANSRVVAPAPERNPLLRDLVVNSFDYREPDKELSPAMFEKKKGNVLFFAKAGCPLAELYATRFQEIVDAHKEEFNFFVVFPSDSETEESIKKSALGNIKNATIVHDSLSLIAKQASIGISPTAQIYFEDFTPVYQGPLDDQYGISHRKPKANLQHVLSRLDELKKGSVPAYASLKTQGCEMELYDHKTDEKAKSDITYHSHIAPIIERGQCLKCHSDGNIAEQFKLGSYADLADDSFTAAERIASRRMPPWQLDPRFGKYHDARRFSPADIRTFLKWIKAGSPRGTAPTAAATTAASASKEPKPDRIWKMDKPFKVPADGVLPYQYVLVDSGVEKDTWASSVTVKPGTPSVVHHVRAFVIPGDLEAEPLTTLEKMVTHRLKLKGEHLKWAPILWGKGNHPSPTALGSFTPGTARSFPKDMGVLIPKGSKILFELHYTPNGKAATDLSEIQATFSKEPAKYQIQELPLGPKLSIKIPPGDPNYSLSTDYEFPKKARLVSFRPHMHVRGKSYKLEIVRPGKEPETLLSIPVWDYKWQTHYELETPIDVEPGTKLIATSTWDNSAANPNNPDPTAKVTFGPDITDEMAMAYVTLAFLE